MADDEYPAWLWGVLDKTKGNEAGAGGAGAVDEADLYGEYCVFFCFCFWFSLVEGGWL